MAWLGSDRKFFLGICILGAGMGLPGFSAAAESEKIVTLAMWERQLDRSLRWELSQLLMERGHYARAALELERVREEFPKDRKVLALLGSAYLLLGNGDDGEACIRAALEQEPDSPELQALLGRILVGRGESRQGAALLERALDEQPDQPSLRLVLAETYLSSGDVRKAGPHLKLAAAAAEEDRQYLDYFYSRYWTAMGDYPTARRHAAAAYRADPARPLYQKEFGMAAFRVNELETAVRHLGDALRGGDTDPMVFLYLGEALFQTRHWEAAEAVWRRGGGLHPQSFPLHLRLVEFLDQTARPAEAENEVGAYEKRMGRVPEAGLLRIHHERLTGFPNLALRLLQKWKLRTRGALAVELRWEEAQLLFETGQYGDAQRAANRLIRENCHVAEAYMLKAKVARFQLKPEEAENFMRMAREANPFGPSGPAVRSFGLSAAAQHPELLAANRP